MQGELEHRQDSGGLLSGPWRVIVPRHPWETLGQSATELAATDLQLSFGLPHSDTVIRHFLGLLMLAW